VEIAGGVVRIAWEFAVVEMAATAQMATPFDLGDSRTSAGYECCFLGWKTSVNGAAFACWAAVGARCAQATEQPCSDVEAAAYMPEVPSTDGAAEACASPRTDG